MLNFTAHFIPLANKLHQNKIHFDIVTCNDGLAIILDDGSDIALNSATYGASDGLLEGYKGVFKQPDDDVTGYMTADEAIAKILYK